MKVNVLLKLKRCFITGLLIWIPILITGWVIMILIKLLNSSEHLLPNQSIVVQIPGLGIVISILVILGTGLLSMNILGRRLLKFWNSFISKIPLVRTIYIGVQQAIETLFQSNSQAFRQVLLVEYPRKGMWSLAFQTGYAFQEINEKTGDKMVAVFIPTTPNPTSGFLLFVPKSQAYELNISVDMALKILLSLGVIQSNPANNI